MAYTSKVKGLGYQRTAIRPERINSNNELTQIAQSLKGFEKSFDKFTKNYKNEEQENAQIVFDTLKAQGIKFVDFSKKDIARAQEIRTDVIKKLKGKLISVKAIKMLEQYR